MQARLAINKIRDKRKRDLLKDNPLDPNESETIENVALVDLCETGTFSVAVEAEAALPSGDRCGAANEVIFFVLPPLAPACSFELELSCQLENGDACEDLTERNTSCI